MNNTYSIKSPFIQKTIKTALFGLALSSLLSCGGGGSSSEPDVNSPPSVNAGIDQSINENSPVTLSGTASDSDGSVIKYTWLQTLGTTVTPDSLEEPTLSFESPEIETEEVLEFQLTAEDNEGGISTDTVTVTVSPTFFSITLSNNINKCGMTVAEDVEISFFDSDGIESPYTVEHSGIEQTYSFAETPSERKTIHIVKKGWDHIIVDANPLGHFFIEMKEADSEACNCPEYDVILIDENNEYGNNPYLVTNSSGTNPDLEEANSVTWENIALCDGNTFYITHIASQKFALVSPGESATITVNELTDIASTEIDGIILQTTRSHFLPPRTYQQAYTTVDSSGELQIIATFTNNDLSDGMLNYLDNPQISDLIASVKMPAGYVNIDISTPPRFAPNIKNRATNSSEEVHEIAGPKELFESALSYDIYTFDALDISISTNEILITGTDSLPFESLQLFYVNGSSETREWLDIIIPIENNRVDLTRVYDVIGALEHGFWFFRFNDYENIDSFDDSNDIYFRKKISGHTHKSKHILFLAF